MRVLFASTLLAAAALLGCSSDGRCAIDSDCALGFRCAANACTPIGAAIDAGQSLDANASVDAHATSDTPGPDAPGFDASVDAQSMVDTNNTLMLACSTIPSTQRVVDVRGCSGVTATSVTITGPGPSPDCAIELESDVRRNISGMMMRVGGVITGNVSVGMTSYVDCTLTSGSFRAERVLTCGTCVVTFNDAL